MSLSHLLPNTLYVCTHRCECPICRENSKSRLSPLALFRAFTDTSVSLDPPISAGALARATRGSVSVALEEVGVHDERQTPAEKDLRTRPYLSGARMSAVVVPSLRELTLFHRLSAPAPHPAPPTITVWFTYSTASWTKSNFGLTVKRN